MSPTLRLIGMKPSSHASASARVSCGEPFAAGSVAGIPAGAGTGVALGAALFAGGVFAGAGPCASAAQLDNRMAAQLTLKRSERMFSSGNRFGRLTAAELRYPNPDIIILIGESSIFVYLARLECGQ